jgi:hypothetical protein
LWVIFASGSHPLSQNWQKKRFFAGCECSTGIRREKKSFFLLIAVKYTTFEMVVDLSND